MKKITGLFLLLLVSAVAISQSQYKARYIAAGFQPHYALHFFSAKNNAIADSLQNIQKNRTGYSFFVHFQKQMGKDRLLQIGVQYTNIGFVRVAKNLTFKSRIHPDLPALDQSIDALPSPSAEMNYVFDYLDIPVLMNRRLSLAKKSKQWEFYFTYGGSLNFLLQDRVAARLRGFTINGDRAFNLPNTYLKPTFFNITAHAGLRASYNYSNKLGFITQPIVNLPLLTTTTGDLSYRLLSVGVQVGFYFNLDAKGEEEVIE